MHFDIGRCTSPAALLRRHDKHLELLKAAIESFEIIIEPLKVAMEPLKAILRFGRWKWLMEVEAGRWRSWHGGRGGPVAALRLIKFNYLSFTKCIRILGMQIPNFCAQM